tara:strand:+ start:1681 stop:2385 length:705 start_codon:yes stop_codon:yes gene_type:complete
MINLKIGEQKYSMPNEWNEITLDEYKKIVEIIKDNEFVEPKVEDLPTDQEGKEALEKERSFSNVKSNRKLLAHLAKIDEETINKCELNDVNNALNIMTEFLNNQSVTQYSEGIKYKFDFKGTTYYFPDHQMKKSTFGDYIETAQLDMLDKQGKSGRMSVIAEQMAILCREKNEEYDEVKVLKKTKIFGKLTMNVVWDFLFFLTKQIQDYQKNIQMFSKAGTEIKTATLQNIGKL